MKMELSRSDWNKIVEELGPQLFRYFCGTFSSATSSDLVQETFIRLVQKQQNNEFNPSKGSFKNYAFGIAHFVRLEAFKGQKDFILVDDDSELDIAVSTDVDKSNRTVFLKWAISKLKPIEQEIILFCIDDELKLEDISQIIGVPLGTVKNHVHRAKEKLQKIMEVSNEK